MTLLRRTAVAVFGFFWSFAVVSSTPYLSNQAGGTIIKNAFLTRSKMQSILCRGGARNKVHFAPTLTTPPETEEEAEEGEEGDEDEDEDEEQDVFTMLAHAVQHRLSHSADSNDENPQPPPTIADLIQTFQSMSKAQRAFKGLDGVAHEAYQRTHKRSTKKEEVLKEVTAVSGRASRVAARTSAVAVALGACELCELVLHPPAGVLDGAMNTNTNSTSPLEGPLTNRQVLLNETMEVSPSSKQRRKGESLLSFQVLVLYEPLYMGGAGIRYGDLEELIRSEDDLDGGSKNSHPRRRRRRATMIQGRLLVAVGVPNESLDLALNVLSQPPLHVRLQQGQAATNEAASVQPLLHAASTLLLERMEPLLRQYNQSAIHLVGHSLGGGIACIAATMLDGRLPLKTKKQKKKNASKKQKNKSKKNATDEQLPDGSLSNSTGSDQNQPTNETFILLQGFGKGRTSAVALGAPPCISSNVQTDVIVNILVGDDFVGRATSDSLERFVQRTKKGLESHKKKRFFLTSSFHRMTDTLSLAASNLQSYAHGSEGEEARLSVPGRAYLVRPRRLFGVCSIHEFGHTQLKGGREAIRASVLWQLNDLLLSTSMWKHHQLEMYIQSLDRVYLRGLEDDEGDEDAEDN
ncbi:hypothetical protein ACA910_011341 [Epithemia clementina (nom. ined.)]